MPIRINCKHCGKKFSAWDDLVGKSVKCPKCQKEMTVPGGEMGIASSPSADVVSLGEEDIVAPPAAGYEPLPHADSSDVASGLSLPMPSVTPPAAARPAASPTAPTSADDDLDDGDDLPFACPNCHQPMPQQEDLCDHCGFHRILKRKIDIADGINKPDNSTGFERAFRGQLEDADSADNMLKILKIVGLLVAVAFLFVCRPYSWFVAIIGGVGFFLYRKKQVASSSANDSAINQDAMSSTAWTLMLSLQRAIGWRLLAWPFPKTKALILHDSTFTDADLGDLDELPQYEALDLEGTQVTNDGLRHLERHKQLRYLVFRQTNVTVSGVQKLQQILPEASIWF
ncbi:MAG: hypothetical protein CMJ64_10100 [Planctomycetaceae bacterium]|nr:hypothetical protein [Planctomycetaceae bacterium]